MTTWFISRHPGAIAWAREQALPIDQFITHFDPSQVMAGDTVVGTLPVHLAADVCQRGARYLHLTMALPETLRGQELSAEQLRALNVRLQQFEVMVGPLIDGL